MDNSLSITRIILLTYVILGSSYCTNLFSKSLKKSIEENRFAQHLILLILIMTLMSLFNNSIGFHITQSPEINTIILSLVVYVWFIMTTKLDITWNLSILIILTIYFLYENRKTNEINDMMSDSTLSVKQKADIVNSYVDIQKYVMSLIFGITVVGTYFYAEEKETQYGGGFDYMKFFME